jgi:prepilin-type N-terminal cleavage/methylation domain-containing protein
MSFNKKIKEQGFTIVELLIVIVVIGILAAITIVAYNGIQNRAKANSGQVLASNIAKKFEAYNSVNGAYPTTKTQIQGTSESKIDGLPAATTAGTDPLVVPNTDTLFSSTALVSGTANNGKTVRVTGSATGGSVKYFDFVNSNEGSISYGAGS